jgi:hypothetical protein
MFRRRNDQRPEWVDFSTLDLSWLGDDQEETDNTIHLDTSWLPEPESTDPGDGI